MDLKREPTIQADEGHHAAELLDLGDAFFELDGEWRIIRVNRNQEKLSQKPREETLGRVFWEVWPETADPGSPYWVEYHRCMERRVPVQFEAYFEPLDLWTGVTAYPVSTGGIAVFFRDVSAVKRAETQARRRAAEVEAVLSSVADGVVVYDSDGRIIRANDAARAILGFTDAESAMTLRERLASVGARWFSEGGEPLAPEDLPAVRAARHGETHRGAVVRMSRGGVDTWLRISAAPLYVGDAQAGAVVSLADITARKRADEASAREHELLARLFERVPVMIAMYDPKLGTFRFNKAFEDLVGWTEADAAAGDLMALAYPDPGVRAAAAEHMQSLAPGWREFPVTAKDGSVVLSAWANLRLSDDTHVGIGIDLRERKAAEQALRDSEARLRRMVDANPIGVVNRDMTGRVLYANDAYLRIIRASRDDLAHGRVRWDVITAPEHRARDTEATAEAKRAGVSSIFEKEYVLGDGTRVPVLVAFASMGTPGELTAFVVDITDRKRAEDALRRSEQELRRLADAMPQLVWTARADGAVDYMNGRHAGLYGAHRDAEGAWTWSPAIHPDDVEATLAGWRRAIAAGEAYEMEQRVRVADGVYRWHLARAEPVRDEAGRVVRWYGTTTDIHELKEAQRALRDADRRKDEFLGMLSHELRNPLAPIRNALYILDRAAPGGEQARRAKEVANRQIAHMTRLVDDLLDVTRIGRGKIELRRADIDLGDLVYRIAEDHRALMQERRLELGVRLPAEHVIVNADATRLAQVLGNLLHNSAKFTPAGGHVTVAVAVEEDRAVIRVRDTGPGIAPEVLPTIFEPFTQAKQTLARTEGGLGLGLALVKGLVGLHGGEVRAYSGDGEGTEFVVSLPLATHSSAPAPEPGSNPGADGGGRRVLVIDDNHDAADTVAELVKMFGHDVDVAYDANEGLAKASEAMPDVVFCDIGLPGMDGYEFARQLRAVAPKHRVRLVALSGYAQPEDVAKAITAGFDAHVAKPPDPEALAGMLG